MTTEQDARDAARYRWLRYLSLDMNFIADEWGWAGGSPDQLDSAIDAALAAEKNDSGQNDSGKGEQT